MIPIEKLSGQQITTIIAVINAIICMLLLLAGGIIGYWISDIKHRKKKKNIKKNKIVIIKDDGVEYEDDSEKYEQIPLAEMVNESANALKEIISETANAFEEFGTKLTRDLTSIDKDNKK